MNEQYATYQVPIWQAGWALATLRSAGIPILNTDRRGDIIVIIIPAQYAEFNHRTAAPAAVRPRRPVRIPRKVMLGIAVTAALLAIVLWLGPIILLAVPIGVGAYVLIRNRGWMAELSELVKGFRHGR